MVSESKPFEVAKAIDVAKHFNYKAYKDSYKNRLDVDKKVASMHEHYHDEMTSQKLLVDHITCKNTGALDWMMQIETTVKL